MIQKKQKKAVKEPIMTYSACPGSFAPVGCSTDNTKSEGSVFSVFDPVQGPVEDCYLISALASVAWVSENDLSRYGDRGDYTFRTDTENIGSKAVLVNSTTPYKPSGAQFGPNNYYWPLWYEKAYAKFRNCTNYPGTTCPDVSQLKGGVGLQALYDIAINYSNQYSFDIKWSDGTTSILNKLNTITNPGAKTIYPAVAWTSTATTQLKSGHTYSYLGYVKKKITSTTYDYYIVLRDPCKVEPTSNVLTSSKWPSTTTGPIDFANPNGIDGIFGLKLSALTSTLTIGYVK